MTRHGVLAATVSSRPAARREAANTASVGAGSVLHESRGRSVTAAGSVSPTRSASSGLAARMRAARTRASASGSVTAGAVMEPRIRQRSAGRPSTVIAVVAAPASTARIARGIVVTSSGVPGRLLGKLLESLDELLDAVVVGEDRRRAGDVAAEQPAEDRVEEQHGVGAEGVIGPGRVEELHRRCRQAAQLDFTGDLFDELVTLLVAHALHVRHDPFDLLELVASLAATGPESRVRTPTGPEAAWYTRGRRRAMDVTTSQELVERLGATSATGISASPCRPMSTNSSV